MRDWARSARPASFRGARFHVDVDGPESGRRIVVHDVTSGEAALTEDLGALQRRFAVDAYIASDRADLLGLALEAACSRPGAGLLMLPFDAPVMAHCEACTRDRRRDRMGYFAYRLDFVEAGGAAAAFASPIGAMREVFSAGAADAASGLARLFR